MKNIVVCVFLLSCARSILGQSCPWYTVNITEGVTGNSTFLEPVFESFRTVLGGESNGNTPGPLFSGHRSVNWDAPVVPFNMPGDFFKNTVTRGITFETENGGFRVSNPPSGNGTFEDDRFSSFDLSFSGRFKRFSLERLFTSVWNNTITATFSIPAVGNQAVVSGFGAVFTDVTKWQSTSMSFYDINDCLIKNVFIKPKARGLSFAGIHSVKKGGQPTDLAIYKVVFKLGDATVASPRKNWQDVVVVDDLIYGEPQAL